jgi:hypothetical protein
MAIDHRAIWCTTHDRRAAWDDHSPLSRYRHWHRGRWLLPSSSQCLWQATSNGLTVAVRSVIVLASAFDPGRASPDPDLDRRAAALRTIRRIRTSSPRQVRTSVIAARPDIRHSGMTARWMVRPLFGDKAVDLASILSGCSVRRNASIWCSGRRLLRHCLCAPTPRA